MNRKIVVILISVFWLIIAFWLVAYKEHTLKTGKKIVLETVPVDPRDILRGDFVVLSYKISTLVLNDIQADKTSYRPGEVIFVQLEPKGDFWEAAAIKTKKCGDAAVCIRGKVRSCYSGKIFVYYGIESYFVPEGKGKDIERSVQQRDARRVRVEVIVDGSGNAVIHDLLIH